MKSCFNKARQSHKYEILISVFEMNGNTVMSMPQFNMLLNSTMFA